VPEVLIAARAMKAGMAVLKPLLSAKDGSTRPKGVLLMGTVRGDLHDIGKNLVLMMAEGAGFEVHDIGVDQSVEKFLAAAEKCKPDIVGMSALLTTTMTYMKTVIDGVLNANLPWGLVLTGSSFAIVAELLGVPSLAFAVGIYLPLSTMTPVFAGGCLRALVEKRARRRGGSEADTNKHTERGVLLASGLIAGEGVMGIGSWNPKTGPAAKAYFDAHVKRWKKEPDRWASAHCWAGLQILQAAVEKVGLDRKKIRDYIAGTEHDTIIGKMQFKGSENVSTPGVVSQWQNGEFEVVWPPQRATSAALFPKPDWK